MEVDEEIAAKDEVVARFTVDGARGGQVTPLETNAAAQFVAHVPVLVLDRATRGLEIGRHVFERMGRIDAPLSYGKRRVRNIECVNRESGARDCGAVQNCRQGICLLAGAAGSRQDAQRPGTTGRDALCPDAEVIEYSRVAKEPGL